VGLTYAKGLAYSIDKPFIGINHIEGHIFSGFLMDDKPDFPFLALVVSGGHTLLLLVNNFNEIIKLGSTVDDAAGEAFDKVSKMIGLGYPGGPRIQDAAIKGDEKKINFPVAQLKDPYNFSFSGVKTSVLRYVQSLTDKPDDKMISDIAASFQNSVVRALIEKLEKAINNFPVKSVSIVGGVAANKLLRESSLLVTKKHNLKLVIPAFEYCGDNAAMIAFRGSSLYESGVRDTLDFKPFPGITKDHFKELK
jgi:N6-L-threonylcarbamoyladenine synthase